jgi:hypothetical protein
VNDEPRAKGGRLEHALPGMVINRLTKVNRIIIKGGAQGRRAIRPVSAAEIPIHAWNTM